MISVSGGATATFVDDVTQNGILQVVSVGNTHSSAVFFGDFGGAGGFVGGGDVFALGDLRPGNSPASVQLDGNFYLGTQSTTEIELGGVLPGEYDQLVVSGEFSIAGNLEVSLINGFTPGYGDAFLIADIQGVRSGEFAGLPNGASVGSGLYIYYDGGDGNDVVLSTIPPQMEIQPATLLVTRGTLVSGEVPEILNSDNLDLSIQRSNSDVTSRTEFEVTAISPISNPVTLSVTLEGAVFARSLVNQTVSLYDYTLGTWEVVDTRAARRFTDRVDQIDVTTGDLSRFVNPVTGEMKGRVLYLSPNRRQQFASNTDQFSWTVGGTE